MTHNSAILTTAEWEAVALLRAAVGVGLIHGVLALPERMQNAIDVARSLLDRTRDQIGE